ncbi:hypothetical protein O7614_15060 [Micromonospora sp. WMMD961]|uniref:hypothetical protein n=1 Tax=Micromonospora sp. WMMD961 TaxID=3016100 RepID=UPI0024163FE6|nr:hypothetical protein [Micromonospora sp. WMMD961]MDG4780964.1 hypothetical protein [Micromonospora sp. WMMD961]
MARYKAQNRIIKAVLTAKDEDRIAEEMIQPVLDEGTENGWTLHSFQATPAGLVFIWELPD